jgi:hypothetical protein
MREVKGHLKSLDKHRGNSELINSLQIYFQLGNRREAKPKPQAQCKPGSCSNRLADQAIGKTHTSYKCYTQSKDLAWQANIGEE